MQGLGKLSKVLSAGKYVLAGGNYAEILIIFGTVYSGAGAGETIKSFSSRKVCGDSYYFWDNVGARFGETVKSFSTRKVCGDSDYFWDSASFQPLLFCTYSTYILVIPVLSEKVQFVFLFF